MHNLSLSEKQLTSGGVNETKQPLPKTEMLCTYVSEYFISQVFGSTRQECEEKCRELGGTLHKCGNGFLEDKLQALMKKSVSS